MQEREQFFQTFQRFVTAYIHRIQKMSETQVLSGLRAMEAARTSHREALAFLNSVSLAPTDDSDEEIRKLRRQLSSTERAALNPSFIFDYIEDALKQRLETLRRNPDSNS